MTIRATALAAGLATLLLSGTALSALPAEQGKGAGFHEDAQRLLRKGDPRAALVQMRNAVQAEPENLEYRRTLGELYLAAGDAAAAEKELSRSLGRLPDDRTALLLAQAQLAQGKAEAVVERLRATAADPMLQRDQALLLARAHLALGDADEAAKAYSLAAKLDPTSADAATGLAQLDLAAGRDGDAAAKVASVLARDPGNAEALLLSATLAEKGQRLGDAFTALERAAAAAPQDPRVDYARVQLLVRAKRAAEAEQAARAMLRRFPGNSGAQLALVLALAAGDKYADAAQALLPVEDKLPAQPDMLVLAALVKIQSGQSAQGERYLLRLLSDMPGQPDALQALAALRLRDGNPKGAIELLEPGRDTAPAGLLRLLAGAYVQDGRTEDAAALFQRLAATGSPAAGEAQASLGLLAMPGQGDATGQKLLLAAERARAGDTPGAVALMRELRAANPAEALYPTLEGRLLAGSGDAAGAEAAFTQALALKPTEAQALAGLANLREQAGDLGSAVALVRRHLDKGGPGAAMLLASLLDRQGNRAEARSVLEQAAARSPDLLPPRLALLDLARRGGDKAALVAAARGLAATNRPEALDRAARTLAAAGELAEAERMAASLVAQAPDSAPAHLLLATLMTGPRRADAIALLDGFDKRRPGNPAILTALADLRLTAQDVTGAEAAAIRLAAADPVQGTALKARVLARSGRLPQAVALLADLAEKSPAPGVARDLYLARMAQGESAAALSGLQGWLAREPGDLESRRLLAAHYMAAGDRTNAEAEYRRLSVAAPEDPVTLNNLAWLRHEAGGGDALDLARRAVTLAPDAPEVLDTLGAIHLARGETAEALKHARRAAELAPGNPDIHLTYARAVAATGDRPQAAKILRASFTDGQPRPEAAKLLAEWER